MHINNILVPAQFGFRKVVFPENAAFSLTHSVFISINQKMHVGGILCNLARSFYYVNHEILLTKLHFYSIQGLAANWFRSYLSGRRQKLEINSSDDTHNFW
jgi:hypothetical protein